VGKLILDSRRSVDLVTSPNDLPRTLGELRSSGHQERSIKQEIRENLLARLADVLHRQTRPPPQQRGMP
jgi:magnesium chelatase subunit I